MRCSRVASSAETLESSATDRACGVAMAAMNRCHPCAQTGSWVSPKSEGWSRVMGVDQTEFSAHAPSPFYCCPVPGMFPFLRSRVSSLHTLSVARVIYRLGSTQTQHSYFASGALTLASNRFGCFDSRRGSSILRIRFETRTK